MAEAVRFELTEVVKPRQFSRLVHSTALPSFRILIDNLQQFDAVALNCFAIYLIAAARRELYRACMITQARSGAG